MSTKAVDRLVLVKYRPGIKRRLWVTFLFGCVVSIGIGYWSGHAYLLLQNDQLRQQLERLAQDLSVSRQNEATLRQQVINLESGRTIDTMAQQEIQNTIQALETTVALLRKDVAFYKNIMAPSDDARGLQLQNIEIRAVQTANRYSYKFVLAQLLDQKAYLSGVLVVNLIGQRNETQEVIPLRDISQEKELGINFRFKYFQEISGELTLPEDFRPESVQIVAQSSGKTASRIEHSFSWSELTAKKF